VPDAIDIQAQARVRGGVRNPDQRCTDLGLDPQFFVQFPHQRRLRGFPGFNLAAGKFPQPGQFPPGDPPRQQNAPARIAEHSGGDVNASGRSGADQVSAISRHPRSG